MFHSCTGAVATRTARGARGVVPLRPEMASRRLQVLSFVRDYIGRWGASLSLGNIAAGCGTNPKRAHDLIKS